MSDLEQRLADALTEGAQGAPSATGLAAAARGAGPPQAAEPASPAGPRWWRWPSAYPRAVVASAATTGEANGSRPADQGNTAVDANAATTPATDPEHWPGRLPLGELARRDRPGARTRGCTAASSDWCADGGRARPRGSSGPGRARRDVLCDPASTYGVTFQAIDNTRRLRVAAWSTRTGGGWPAETTSAAGASAACWSGRDPQSPTRRATSWTRCSAIDRRGTPTAARSTPARIPSSPEDAMTVCRYDERRSARAERAAQRRRPGGCRDGAAGGPGRRTRKVCDGDPGQTFRMASVAEDARIDLNCNTLLVHGEARELTEDVLYWALSPGWSGTVPGDVSLPSELR